MSQSPEHDDSQPEPGANNTSNGDVGASTVDPVQENQERTIEPSSIVSHSNEPSTSMFLRLLPPEIRLMIYDYVFLRAVTTGQPGDHTLALRRTCRFIENEIDNRWLRFVYFKFDTALAWNRALTNLPKETVSQIRYITLAKNEADEVDLSPETPYGMPIKRTKTQRHFMTYTYRKNGNIITLPIDIMGQP